VLGQDHREAAHHDPRSFALGVGYLTVTSAVVIVLLVLGLATQAAAVAAIATMGVIAYQSWQTRLATLAAQRGLDTAERSIKVSQASALEAEKARLEQRAPRLVVSIGRPEWPPSRQPLFAGGELGQHEEGRAFRMPAAAQEPVGLRAEGRIRNEGQRSVRVRLDNVHVKRMHAIQVGEPSPTGNVSQKLETRWEPPTAAGYEQWLPADAEITFRVDETRPASQWVENDVARREEGKPGPNAIIAQIVADDGMDNGVIDRWTIELGGFPLEPVPGEGMSWRIGSYLPDQRPVHAVVRPQERLFYRSKSANQPLPVIEL
jgi:hypothetical protein